MLKILQWIIGVFACILLINLVWTVTSLDHSIMYLVSSSLDNNASETIKDFKDSWAIRGQMGDILSGHFSALAFLAVAFSILLQNEANRKMQTSIEKQDKALEQQDKSLQQQSKALEVQSESLKAQIEELQQSRKESERQTEEFFISNMNIKLERYYKLLDNQVTIVDKTNAIYMYNEANKVIKKDPHMNNIEEYQLKSINAEIEILKVIEILSRTQETITSLQKTYPKAYKDFINEFEIKILSMNTLQDINHKYDKKGEHDIFLFF